MSDGPQGLTHSYMDFAGLGQLRSRAEQDQQGAVREVAQQFEAYFLQEIMKSMRATVENGGLVDSNAVSTYQDMMDKEVAQSMAKGRGIGLADMMVSQLAKAPASAQAALAQHPSASLSLQAKPMALPEGPDRGMALPADTTRRSLK
jgi:peptidoglycan hydrolase FlgJ